ncbi:MAG: VOC family protein [Clostridiales bacterium]|nr:VOC family protein [Clostridiales bacterium]
MTFIGICIITENVSRLTEFYKKVLQTTADGDDTHAVINTKGASISIFSKDGMENMVAGSTKNTGNGSYTIAFEVNDVDAEYERLKEMNVEFLMLPTTYPWGCRALWFKDPDGNIVDFASKV